MAHDGEYQGASRLRSLPMSPARFSTSNPVRFQQIDRANLLPFVEWAMDRAWEAVTLRKPQATTLHLPSLEVSLLTDNEHYQQIVGDRLCHHASGAQKNGITVAVLSREDSEMPLPPVWGESIYHPREIEKQLSDTPFRATYFHDDGLWQIYDVHQRFGLQWMSGKFRHPPWEAGAPLRVFLHWAYQTLGHRLVHAGSLGKGGRGILLVGKGGSGKSGTVVGGISCGLRSVGDDYVLVQMNENRPTAYPLFQTLKQDLKGLQRLELEHLLGPTRHANWQNKYELKSEDIGQPLADRLAIGAIVIPHITGGPKSSFHPLSRSHAMLALAPSSLMQLPAERDSGVRFFSNLIRSVPCFQLNVGTDPHEISDTISALMERRYQCS